MLSLNDPVVVSVFLHIHIPFGHRVSNISKEIIQRCMRVFDAVKAHRLRALFVFDGPLGVIPPEGISNLDLVGHKLIGTRNRRLKKCGKVLGLARGDARVILKECETLTHLGNPALMLPQGHEARRL